MTDKIGVGILGGTGYGAGELLRILSSHPRTNVISVVSRSQSGKSLCSAHPALSGFYELDFEAELNLDKLGDYSSSVIFASLPHTVGISIIEELLPKIQDLNIRLIDLSGDLRLKSPEVHKEFYPDTPIAESLRSSFTYGLSEILREDIKQSKFVSNPGCYPTASALSVYPLVQDGYEGSIHFDAKSGSSGAGRGTGDFFHHPNVGSSVTAYKALQHRHEPEIRQALGDPLGDRISTMFVPQLLPITRGILVTSYLEAEKEYGSEELYELYSNCYKDSPFVRVRKSPPSLKYVIGSNFCDVYAYARGKQIIAMAAEDNLVKGMAGQAVQNMNLMCGLDETAGLWSPPLGLV